MLASMTFLAGCGARQTQVSGTITFDDRPLASGTVMAVGSDGEPRYSEIDDSGQYAIDSLPSGVIIWAVTCPDPNAKIVLRPPPDQPFVAAPPSPAGNWFTIPERYEATSTSHLRCQLQRGHNRFDIKLTK